MKNKTKVIKNMYRSMKNKTKKAVSKAMTEEDEDRLTKLNIVYVEC